MDFECRNDIWPRNYGYLRESVLEGLRGEAERAIARFRRAGDPSLEERKRHGYHLINLLRNALQRLERIPGSFLHTVAVTAHVQRLVLELSGFSTYLEVVRPALRDPFHFTPVTLDVRGGFLNNAATASEFFRVGVPFWLFQHYTPDICIKSVVTEFVPISSALDLEPAFPALERAKYDPTGVWQDPSKWPAPMVLQSSYLFASATLPRMLPPLPSSPAIPRASGTGEPSTKRAKGADPEPPSKTSDKSKKKANARRGARGAKKKARDPHPAFVHALPPPQHPQPPAPWARSLVAVGSLPDPPLHAAVYYFPPPYLFAPDDPKSTRYLHNWIRIRTFCRQRLVDITIDGSPMRLSEWRNALWGDYTVPADDDREATASNVYTQAQQAARERKLELRRLFAGAGSLPSYEPTCTVEWASQVVSASDVAADAKLRASVLWELHELNFRCELRDLDRELLGGVLDKNTFFQWERGDVIAGVWGSSGALSVFPDVERGEVTDSWTAPSLHSWANRRETFKAFLVVMSRWPDFPQDLWPWCTTLTSCTDIDQFVRIEERALKFYVRCFADKYGRLPISPVHPAPAMLEHVPSSSSSRSQAAVIDAS